MFSLRETLILCQLYELYKLNKLCEPCKPYKLNLHGQ